MVIEMQKNEKLASKTCMVAGPDNEGKKNNPLWETCRYCCSYCPKIDQIFCSSDCLEGNHLCRKKCNRTKKEFCAWRTDEETQVWIDLGLKDGREVYTENVKKREKMVSYSSSTSKNIP